MTISISESKDTAKAMSNLLRRIANKIDEGYTSGYFPTWELTAEEGDQDEI